jgi:hypothetical protein
LLAVKIAAVKWVIRLIPFFPVHLDVVPGASDASRPKDLILFVFNGSTREGQLPRGPKG